MSHFAWLKWELLVGQQLVSSLEPWKSWSECLAKDDSFRSLEKWKGQLISVWLGDTNATYIYKYKYISIPYTNTYCTDEQHTHKWLSVVYVWLLICYCVYNTFCTHEPTIHKQPCTIYIYIYIWLCVWSYVSIYIYLYIYICIHMHTCKWL